MPLRRYGVINGRVLDRRLAIAKNPHYQILIDSGKQKFRASVNVKSEAFPSELLYHAIDNFHHPITDMLNNLNLGYTHLKPRRDSAALDLVRGNLLDVAEMIRMPFDKPGPDNDLNEMLDHFILRAMNEDYIGQDGTVQHPRIYAFGQRWGPERKRDKIFGFKPGNGIHDIHMNQGNIKRWQGDDGPWQDGSLIFYYPQTQQWSAVFLAFQTQSFHTDDLTGRRILGEPVSRHRPEPESEPDIPARADPATVRIIAALVNPPGDDFGKETVTLLNTTDQDVNLDGWAIADKNARMERIHNQILGAGETLRITLSGYNTQLSNKGGIITLLNHKNIKIHGVAYTQKQASEHEGETLVF